MKIHFATMATSRYWTSEAILLAKSLRAFGGNFSASPITILTPHDEFFPSQLMDELDQKTIQVEEFTLPEAAARFPLGMIPFAAAAAEAQLGDQCDLLVWLLPDTLILNPPDVFVLPEGKSLAYRPVHHQNIGSHFGHPPDDFWQLIYQHTGTPEEHLFKMVTCYREAVRPYFNAGILALRPESGLLHKWAEGFEHTFQHPDFTPFYANQLYAIFMHQAVLTGVILHNCSPDKLIFLPENYNYPLHMHADYPADGKVGQLADLVTARYENTRQLPDFISTFEDRQKILKLLPG